LVLGIGDGTKSMANFLSGSKGYFAVGKLGTATDTLDSTGNVTQIRSCDHIVSMDMISSTLPQFTGQILQTPPMYSALKKDGQRLYDLARAGVEVERAQRPVTVYNLTLGNPSKYKLEGEDDLSKLPYICLEVECSGGFYVRTLIDDLGVALGTAAHMTHLVRTKQGPFYIENCLPPSKWTFDDIQNQIKGCNDIMKVEILL